MKYPEIRKHEIIYVQTFIERWQKKNKIYQSCALWDSKISTRIELNPEEIKEYNERFKSDLDAFLTKYEFSNRTRAIYEDFDAVKTKML